MTILQLVRRLEAPPIVSPPAGWRLRHYHSIEDIDRWLALRAAAFADSPFPVRAWTPADFAREISGKPWWRPEALWFVELVDGPELVPIGTAILARRGPADSPTPVIHWLAVLPAYRRRGVGRLLVAQLEWLAWQSGARLPWKLTPPGPTPWRSTRPRVTVKRRRDRMPTFCRAVHCAPAPGTMAHACRTLLNSMRVRIGEPGGTVNTIGP